MKKIVQHIFMVILFVSLQSCIEEFSPATTEFEDVIVIEATITNKLENQKILLSRTFRIDDFKPNAVQNARVEVISDSDTYMFTETEPGTYLSNIAFRAEKNKNYQLSVTTTQGDQYLSEVTQMASESSTIEDVYAVKEISPTGTSGIAIYLDNFDPTGNSKYYTFNYKETFEIIPPFWSSDEFVVTSENPFRFSIEPKTVDDRVCYNTVNSVGRIVADTNLTSEGRVSRLLVTFIPEDEIKISSRYSIEVTQFSNSKKAYDYYKTMNELSSFESVFSAVQPGFIIGNIVSVTNLNEKVIGFFEVAAIDSKRIFFNREDIYDTAYDWNCTEYTPPIAPSFLPLRQLIRTDKVSYLTGGGDSPIIVVDKRCGDCTEYGAIEKPNFWID